MKTFSWGSNSHGQLGLGIESEQSTEPSPVDVKANVRSITGGGKHTILVTENGDLFSCGDNDQGQLSRDEHTKSLKNFERITFEAKFVKVCCGWDFNLALTEEGEVFGWGGNSFGQLGFPHEKDSFTFRPVKVFSGRALDIGTGLRHSVIVSEDGFAFSAGSGKKGQLGVACSGDKKTLSSFTAVPGIKNASKVSCGENHSVLTTRDGSLFAWGDNKFGQLGIDPKTRARSETPLLIKDNITEIHALTSGWSHNAVLTGDGRVITWGRNDYGQLGEARAENWDPRAVDALNGAKQVVLGSNHGVALKGNGEILCWGWNEHGNCGNGNCENVYSPVSLGCFGDAAVVIGTGSAHSFYCIRQ